VAVEDEKRFSESEHIAILDDRVRKETAELQGTVDQLTSEKSELQNALDVAESAKVAAEKAAAEVREEFEAYKKAETEAREAAARKDDRLKELRETASHLGPEFFDEEKNGDRVNRVVAMSEEEFGAYKADLGATKVEGSKLTAVSTLPRETAMQGQPVQTGGAAPSAAGRLLLGGYAPKGA
jgi:chromosome segregation ATPase